MARTSSRFRSNSTANSRKVQASSSLNTSSAPCSNESLMMVLFKRDKFGRTELHRLASGVLVASCDDTGGNYNIKRNLQNRCLARANHLLKRAAAASSNNDNLLHQVMTCQDSESGYTALHRAIYNKNLPMILLLLRFAAAVDHDDEVAISSKAKSTSYIGLIELSGNKNNPMLQDMISIKDNEGYTPIQLLGILYSRDLVDIRNPKSNKLSCYGTEVLTFGSTDHPALGQFRSKAKAASSNNNRVTLGRVEEFATTCPVEVTDALPSDVPDYEISTNFYRETPCCKPNTTAAVKLAVAAHHTLIVTASGHLYAFGLGNGGRLGLKCDDHHHSVVLKPMRVPIPPNKYVVSIAAAENHSLCTTSDGTIYAWGSNRFGQLGSSKATMTVASAPVRVLDLRKEFVTNVAAGDRHSVALTRDGQVYCFGDNKFGQLGWPMTTASTTKPVGKVMWLASSRVAIAIAAADKSTLVLTKPPAVASTSSGILGEDLLLSNINAVYSWGNGSYMPTRVNFPASTSSKSDFPLMVHRNTIKNSNTKSLIVNPVAIACAKYHNVALTEDGKCYTWGLHEEPLAREQQADIASENINSVSAINDSQALFKNNNIMTKIMSSPQLVKGMLPENGGGKVVAVSASEYHTAVLTSAGHLYTWGVTDGNKILGHEGVKYQPIPRRVNGVFHAVGVAAAREHTALLIGTKYPPLFSPFICGSLSDDDIPSLQNLCERKIAENIDIFNVVPVFLMAERMNCSLLADFSFDFIQSNMDTILSVCKEKHLDTLLEESLVIGSNGGNFDPEYDLEGEESTKTDSIPKQLHQASSIMPSRMISQASSVCGNIAQNTLNEFICASVVQPSLKTVQLVNERTDLSNPAEVLKRYDSLWKASRTLTKKLNLVLELEHALDTRSSSSKGGHKIFEGNRKLAEEQREKLSRKPQLEADLSLVKPALEEAHKRMEHFNLFDQWLIRKSSIDESTAVVRDDVKLDTEYSISQTAENKDYSLMKSDEKAAHLASSQTEINNPILFLCDVCNVRCPDAMSLSFHMNGRKHQNWVRKLKCQEEKKLAECMTKQKEWEKTVTTRDPVPKQRGNDKDESESQKDVVQLPKYTLPPPSDHMRVKENSLVSDLAGLNVANVDWAKSIPRKASASPVQKLVSNSALNQQKNVNPCHQSKAATLREIMEQEERQRKLALQSQQESTKSNRTSCENPLIATRSSSFSSKGIIPKQPTVSTVNIGQIWDTHCVKGNLEKHTENSVFLSAVPSPSLSLSLGALVIQAEEKRTKQDAVAATVQPTNEHKKEASTVSPVLKWSSNSKPEINVRSNDNESCQKIKGKASSLVKSKEEEAPFDKKKKVPMSPAWNTGLTQKVTAMDNECCSTYNIVSTRYIDTQATRSLREIQREEEDLKQKSSGVAQGTIWYVERRERSALLGEIQRCQEEEERLLSCLIEEQRFIEEQIAKEVALKKQQQQRRDKNRKAKAASLRHKQKHQKGNMM